MSTSAGIPKTADSPLEAKPKCTARLTSRYHYLVACGMFLLTLLSTMLNDLSLSRWPTAEVIDKRLTSPSHDEHYPSVASAFTRELIQTASNKSQDFFLQRQDAYQRMTRNATPMLLKMQGRPLDVSNLRDTWRMRGIGYAYARHGIILAALLPELPVSTQKRSVVTIYNTLETTPVDCAKWTIYVRVNGPEIFAGSAQPVMSRIFPGQSCHWELPFPLKVPGDYEVDVRLLIYNGKAAPQGNNVLELCETQQNLDIPIEQHPFSVGFLGFKMYSPVESCCEICAREPLCRYWVSTPLSLTPSSNFYKGCELFFDEPEDRLDRELFSRQLVNRRRRLENVHLPAYESKFHPHFRSVTNMTGVAFVRGKPAVFHGKPHPVETSYFVGCGWSYWHTQTYPCLDSALDDAVPVYPSNRFSLDPNDHSSNAIEQAQDASRRQCLPEDEYPRVRFSMMTDVGRWVRYPWPNETTCPNPMQYDLEFSKQFEITEFDGEHPSCWFRDNITIIGDRCMEYCAHKQLQVPWRSSIKREKEHFSKWENYHCQYLELTDAQLQQCVDVRRIGSYRVMGASIAQFVKQFLDLRFQNIRMHNTTLMDNSSKPLSFTLSTFQLPHLLWHKNTSEWKEEFDKVDPVGPDEESYFLTGYYYSSEREPWVTVDHAESISEVMQDILVPKGWRMINGFDVSAAFTYEVATQEDGLHMIGGPVKMVITKLLHYLCKDYIEGEPSFPGDATVSAGD